MKRISIMLTLAVAFTAQAFELTQENRMEIDACWRGIFDREMLNASSEGAPTLKSYRRHLLAVQEGDIQPVGQLIAHVCRGDLWDAFIAEKSVDTTIAYINYLIRVLNGFISEGAAFSFPLRLHEVHAFVGMHECDVQQVCTRLRHAFLAFTIIVSKMDHLATH